MYTETPRVVATFPSSRNPAKKYNVTKDKEGILYCDCMAWRFQNKPSHLRQCKHIMAYVGGRTS